MQTQRRIHWRDAMLIPQGWGEREDKPRSTRWPSGLMARVLKIADHWFLALLRHTRFGFRRAYFFGVRLCGYAFNRLGRLSRKAGR